MNTKLPRVELQNLIEELQKEAERAVARIQQAAAKAVLDAKHFVAGLEFERALPYGQPESIAKILKADHTLVAVIESDWASHAPEEVSLRFSNRNCVTLGHIGLPKGKHRAILFIFEEKES